MERKKTAVEKKKKNHTLLRDLAILSITINNYAVSVSTMKDRFFYGLVSINLNDTDISCKVCFKH